MRLVMVFDAFTCLFKADRFSLGIARLASMIDVLPRTSVGFHRSDRTCAGAPQFAMPALELHPLVQEGDWPNAFRRSTVFVSSDAFANSTPQGYANKAAAPTPYLPLPGDVCLLASRRQVHGQATRPAVPWLEDVPPQPR